MADGKAFTGTPDVSAGNPVDVTIVQTAVGAVDRQRVGIGDPTGLNPDARTTATGALPTDTSTDLLMVHILQQHTRLLRAILFALSQLHVPALDLGFDLSSFDDTNTPTL